MLSYRLVWSRLSGNNGSEIVAAESQEAADQMALHRLRRDAPYGYYRATLIPEEPVP